MTKSQDTNDNTTDDGCIVDVIKLILFVGVSSVAYIVLSTDLREEKFLNHVEAQAPANQKVFLEIVGRTVAAAEEAANDAANLPSVMWR